MTCCPGVEEVGVGGQVVLLCELVALGPGLRRQVGSLGEEHQLAGPLLPTHTHNGSVQ